MMERELLFEIGTEEIPAAFLPKALTDMEEIIRELAGYAGADDPKAMAEEISLVMEGAYVTRQVSGNAASDVARRLIQRTVMHHLR